MRRVLAVFFVAVLILAVLIFLISHGSAVTSLHKQGQDIIDLILTIAQLVGIVILFGLLTIILLQYAQYSRLSRFVFKGFSNASSLNNAAQMPLDFDIIAREELIHQFKLIDNEWGELSGNEDSDSDVLFTDGVFFGQTTQKLDLDKYIPDEFVQDSSVLEDLKAVIESVKDSEGINLMALAEEIAPKEVTPIMKFVEAIAPPRIIRATGYLQWQADKNERTGITFEFVDQGSRRNLLVRTIWWKPKRSEQKVTRSDPQSPSAISLDDLTSTNQVNPDQKELSAPGTDEKLQATSHYIDLLDPAMHWLALMFWKQKMLSNIPFQNYFHKEQEKRRQARLLYLFGAMFYSCIDQYEEHHDFFCQLAIEHFRQASLVDTKWCPPLLYLANLYSFKMQKEKDEMRVKLLKKALELYDKASKRADNTMLDVYLSQQIMIAKALAELVSKVEDYIHAAFKEVEDARHFLDPASFDPGRADCTTYLYNLALWHAYATRWYPAYIRHYKLDAAQYTRRYVAYCLARSKDHTHFNDLWTTFNDDELFQRICGEEELLTLKAALERRAKQVPLADLRDDDFKQVIDDILKAVFKEAKQE